MHQIIFPLSIFVSSTATVDTNYLNSGSRLISGNRLVLYYYPSSSINNNSRPISSSSSLTSRPTNLSESQTLSLVSEQDDRYVTAMMRSGYTHHDAILSLFQRGRGQYTGSRSDDDNYDQSETSISLE
jgi:hypothetical protein